MAIKANKRVLFFNRCYWPDESATAQLLTDLSVALCQRGYEIHVIAAGERSGPSSHQGVSITRIGALASTPQNLLHRGLSSLGFIVRSIVALLCVGRRGDIVVAMTDPPLLSLLLLPFAALRGLRMVHWWQDVYPEVAMRLGVLRENGLIARCLLSLRNWALRHGVNVAISDGMRSHLLSVAPKATVVTIANWSADLKADAGEITAWRTQLGLDEKIVVAYSGNLGRAHEFDTLLAAGDRLRDDPRLHFLIIGGGAQAAAVQQQAQARQLKNWTFLSAQPRSRLATTLGAADIHLATLNPRLGSLIFPSKVQGILSAGRPCLFVGDARGETAHLLSKHDCGLSVQANEAESLALRLRELATDPARRERMGTNARRTYEERFALTFAVSAWLRALDAR